MGKFKIGDLVRVLPRDKALAFSGHGTDAGKEYTVKAVRGNAGDNIDTELWSFFDHEIELIPTFTLTTGKFYRTASGAVTGRVTKGDTGFEAVVDGKVRIFDAAGGAVHGGDDIVEEWVPKVGERVRYSGKSTIYNEKELVGLEGTVTHVGTRESSVKWDREVVRGISTGGAKYHDNLEPLPVVAPAQPAAQEPAAPLKIEAGKFKVGDRVSIGDRHPYILAPSQMSGLVKDVNATTRRGPILVEIDNYGGSLHFLEDELSIVKDTPAAPVAAQVDAIAEEYGPAPTEPDTTLHIKFTSDFSELDAAILVRKKKLKKLIKLARKAGIELREAA